MNTEVPENTQALPPGTRIEEFVIERVLGSGGFGITYLARDTALGRQVVIKENLPVQFAWRDSHSLTVAPRHTTGEDADNFAWSLENFAKEAAMLASLDHPGIVRVLRSFRAFGTAFFVMPFVEGLALDELAKERQDKPFTEEELRKLLERVLDALAYLHDRGIYHRDIKPGNILITNEGIPVLIDFGSARQRLSERSMTVVESAGYTPFEQLQTRGNIGPWSDLYALAATIVKAITGETPPKANDRGFGDPWQPLSGRPLLRKQFSQHFLYGLDRALRLPVEERWQSAEEWKFALAGKLPIPLAASSLAEVISQVKSPASLGDSQSLTSDAPIKSTKTTGKWWIAAAVLTIGALGGWWLQRGDSEARTAPLRPALGGLVITSEPTGAKVVNEAGDALGMTPVELKGLPGGQPWRGRLELKDYQAAAVNSEVVSGDTKLVPVVKLKTLPQKVIVTSEPAGADVLEGATLLGQTPWEDTPREVGSVVGLSLRKTGYDEAKLNGEVVLGKTLLLQASLKATPQKVTATSIPPGAEVMVDGKSLGKTPLEMAGVMPGSTVNYQLTLEGHEEAILQGIVEVGEPLALSATLKPLPKPKFVGMKAGEDDAVEIAPGVSMSFCWIPPGQYLMGSPSIEWGHWSDEMQANVTLSQGFLLASTEVTQAQWQSVMGNNPSEIKGANLPVEKVSWNDAMEFINKINSRKNFPSGWEMSLPTQAQWEYACRAKESGPYSGSLDEMAWYDENSEAKTHPVGTKMANAWGLHDMHGNVWEWCADWYDHSRADATDPTGPDSGNFRVTRGGSSRLSASYCRAAHCGWGDPQNSAPLQGFRPVLAFRNIRSPISNSKERNISEDADRRRFNEAIAKAAIIVHHELAIEYGGGKGLQLRPRDINAHTNPKLEAFQREFGSIWKRWDGEIAKSYVQAVGLHNRRTNPKAAIIKPLLEEAIKETISSSEGFGGSGSLQMYTFAPAHAEWIIGNMRNNKHQRMDDNQFISSLAEEIGYARGDNRTSPAKKVLLPVLALIKKAEKSLPEDDSSFIRHGFLAFFK